jgi:hypothetical protein
LNGLELHNPLSPGRSSRPEIVHRTLAAPL